MWENSPFPTQTYLLTPLRNQSVENTGLALAKEASYGIKYTTNKPKDEQAEGELILG